MHVSIVVNGQEHPLSRVPDLPLQEQLVYAIHLREERPDADPDGYEATLGDLPLPLVRYKSGRSGDVFLEWAWKPDFYTGLFDLGIKYQGRLIYPDDPAAAPLGVGTDTYKLTVKEHEAMVSDLARWTSGWSLPAPGRVMAEVLPEPSESPLDRLDYLLRHWQTVEHFIELVVARPRRRLEGTQVSVPLHRAHRLGEWEFHALLSQRIDWITVRRAPPGLIALAQKTDNLLPATVMQSRSHSTLQVPENAFVRRFLEEIRLWLHRALRALGESREEMVLREQRQARAHAMARQVRAWISQTWMAHITAAQGPLTPSLALIKHPVYGTLWRLYVNWTRAVAIADDGWERVPLERTYQLYEYWCFIAVARETAALLGLSPDQAVSGLARRSRSGNGRVALRPQRQLDLTLGPVRLSYQREFYRSRSGRVGSVSHKMVPDITLEWSGEDDLPEVLLLDPKYRASHQGLLEGLNDMHRYRDALVDSEGRRVVAGGYLICPAEPREQSDREYVGDEYRRRWNFGVCVLKPGTGFEGLKAVLRRHLLDPPHQTLG